MAPSATIPVNSYPPPSEDGSPSKSRNTEPLKKSGALEATFQFEDVTPTIGREITAQIVEDILHAPNADDLLRDLAITSKLPPFSEELGIDPCQSQRTRRCFLPKAGLPNQRIAKEVHPTLGRIDWSTHKLDCTHPSHYQQYQST